MSLTPRLLSVLAPRRARDTSQALLFAGARLVTIAATSIATLLVARMLGVQAYGVYAAGAALAPVLMALGFAGIDQLYLRREFDDRDLPSLLRYWALILLLLGSAVCLAIPGISPAARLVAVLLLVGNVAEIARGWWLLQPQRRGALHVRAQREMIIRLSATAALLGSVLFFRSPIAAALGQALVSVALLAVLTRLGRQHAPSVSAARFRRTLQDGYRYAMSGAMYVVYMNLGGVFLAVLASPSDAGAFRAAFVVYLMATAVPVAINNEALRPRLYHLDGNVASTAALQRRFALINLLVGLAVTTGAVVAAWFVVPAALGPDFEGARVPGLLLSCALPLHFLNSFIGNLLIARRRMRSVLFVQGFGVLLTCLIAPLLISTAGVLGAAASLGVVEASVALAYLATLRWPHYRGRQA